MYIINSCVFYNYTFKMTTTPSVHCAKWGGDDIFAEKYRNNNTCIVQLANCIALNPRGLVKNITETFGEAYNPYRRREKMNNVSTNLPLATLPTRDELGSVKLYRGCPNIINFYTQYVDDQEREKYTNKTFVDTMDHSFQINIKKDSDSDRLKYFKNCLKLLSQLLAEKSNSHIHCLLFPYNCESNLNKYFCEIVDFTANLPHHIDVYILPR